MVTECRQRWGGIERDAFAISDCGAWGRSSAWAEVGQVALELTLCMKE